MALSPVPSSAAQCQIPSGLKSGRDHRHLYLMGQGCKFLALSVRPQAENGSASGHDGDPPAAIRADLFCQVCFASVERVTEPGYS